MAKSSAVRSGVSNKVHLTQAVVDHIPLTDAGQRLYWDVKLPGFGVVVGTSVKSFVVQADIAGRSVRMKVGRAGEPPNWRAPEARAQAVQLLAKMKRGTNPLKEKRAAAARGITLRQAWEGYKATLKNRHRSERTIAAYWESLDRHLKDWLDRPLTDIDRAAVRTRHANIAKSVRTDKANKNRSRLHGEGAANGAMRAFRAVWNRAMREHEGLPPCPTTNIDWYQLTPRKEAVPTTDLAAVYTRIKAIKNGIRRDLFLFFAFTGMREAAAVSVRWDDVDLEQAMLHVPSPKGGKLRAFDLPLSKHLVKILRARKAENEKEFKGSPWVFPAYSKKGHTTESRVDGIPSSHRWRSTYLTCATNVGVNPYAMKLLVNHRLPNTGDVTGTYVASIGEDLRDAQEKITARLLELFAANKSSKKGSKVRPLRRRTSH